MNSILTEEQKKIIEDFNNKHAEDEDNISMISEHMRDNRELYEKIKANPKFDACYKQAINEHIISKGFNVPLFNAGYSDSDETLHEAREYVKHKYKKLDEMKETPEDWQFTENAELPENADTIPETTSNKNYVNIEHVVNLTLNFHL